MSKPKPGAGHNGGPALTAREWFEIIGPRVDEPLPASECGAPWTAYATDEELIRVSKLEAWIARRERAIALLRAERSRVMMRNVRRMRRDQGKEK